MSYLKEVILNLYKDKEIKEFIIANKLNEDDIINNFNVLSTQLENNIICKENPDKCLIDPPGMVSKITWENGKVVLVYHQIKDMNNTVERLFFPSKEEVEKEEIYKSERRTKVFKEVARFTKEYDKNNFSKGVYIHGRFGTGKSFIMQKLAIALSNKGANVIIAYYPDLVRTIKSSIASRDTEVIINKLKYADVLMLDDIGAETNTNFIRDEVLGPILQFRMDSRLPVCMTSNLDLKELGQHFGDTYAGANPINSERIISRIRFLMNEVPLDDKNYRDNI